MLGDERRCQVALVTVPEETPVTEAIETAYALEDEVGVKLGPVVVNSVWPPVDGLREAASELGDRLGGGDESGSTARGQTTRTTEAALTAARYRLARLADQRAELERLATQLPLPQVELPYLFSPSLGPGDLVPLAEALASGPATPTASTTTHRRPPSP